VTSDAAADHIAQIRRRLEAAEMLIWDAEAGGDQETLTEACAIARDMRTQLAALRSPDE
jgi:hypothetical protein